MKATNKTEMLQMIRSFLDSPIVQHNDQSDVWDVLTALRGPDSGEYRIKIATTCVIRHTLMGHNQLFGYDINPDSDSLASIRISLNEEGGLNHFVLHAKRAFEALGLTWTIANLPDKGLNDTLPHM